MTNVKHKQCASTGCTKLPSFGVEWGKATHCASHKTDDMTDVISKRCASTGCTKQPTFGVEWGKATHCASHKTDDMTNVISKQCASTGCTKLPSFGVEWGKATHCASHKTDDMTDVISKRCASTGCTKQPAFGVEWGKATHCASHKTDDMTDVISKRCASTGCTKRPAFGVEWGKATHCSFHKTDDMTDVTHKRCASTGCTKLPTFGVEWGKATHCASHKTDDMTNVKHKQCASTGCTKLPSFGVEWGKATHCASHKTDDMTDVISKRCAHGLRVHGCIKCTPSIACILCKHVLALTPKYQGHCRRCFCKTFPDHPLATRKTSKEDYIAERLIRDFLDLPLLRDKVPENDCNIRRRPDICIERRDRVVIIEIDENQHRGYDTTCEESRVHNVFTALNPADPNAAIRPIVFIRLNVDKYTDEAGKKHPVMINYSKQGIISETQEFELRYNALLESLDEAMTMQPKEPVTTTYLFYSAMTGLPC